MIWLVYGVGAAMCIQSAAKTRDLARPDSEGQTPAFQRGATSRGNDRGSYLRRNIRGPRLLRVLAVN